MAAAQEERFSRKKHDSGFPGNALRFCMRYAQLSGQDIDAVVFYDKPFLKFERILETYFAFAPQGFASFAKGLPVWIKEKMFQKRMILDELQRIDASVDWKKKLLFSEHHLSHAASAFYPSPFESAAILTLDGVGEWATTSCARGAGSDIQLLQEIHFPHSLGLLYSAFTYYTGFRVNSGEYKLMGLAPYGQPKYISHIKDHLIDIKDDGSFRLNMEYFGYATALCMTNAKFAKLFGGPPRQPETRLTQREMDIAASIQVVTEEIILKLARFVRNETGEKNLCLAGGVALNCVANGKLLQEKIFDAVWVQPAAGDAGGALGAALTAAYLWKKQERFLNKDTMDSMAGAYLGPEYSQEDIERRLKKVGARFHVVSDEQLIACCAQALAEGQAVGWHQGRMEFGPRALGNRSILGDARSPVMQKTLNLKVKYRESFRPFAPSVLREDVADWFELSCHSPYMLLVAEVQKNKRLHMTKEQQQLFGIEKLHVPRSTIPAVTHVDYSARVQTVHEETNPRYHALLTRFKAMTDCPVIVNTSFNIRGEPIVESPEDAFRCFMGTELDMLAVGNCILHKKEQDMNLKKNYTNQFALD